MTPWNIRCLLRSKSNPNSVLFLAKSNRAPLEIYEEAKLNPCPIFCVTYTQTQNSLSGRLLFIHELCGLGDTFIDFCFVLFFSHYRLKYLLHPLVFK